MNDISPESPAKCGIVKVDATVIKSGTLADILEQLFPNLQQLSDLERPDVLRSLVAKFSPKTAGRTDGPQSKVLNITYPGSEPLSHPGHEATAKFFTSLMPEREIKNVADLAKCLDVARKTIYQWRKHPCVLTRMQYLTAHRKQQGDMIGRLRWPRIMLAMCKEAEAGDVAAAKFVDERAWPEGTQTGKPTDDLLAPYRTAKESDDAL